MKVKGIKCHRNKLTFMMAMAVLLATIVACGSQSAEKKSEAAAAPVVEENLIEDIVFNYNGIDFTMIAVGGGTFQMGATAEQSKSDKDEKPVHSVTLRNYYIGETEVTQELWIAVMGENPSHFGFGGAYPVDKINYNDCVAFINRLNELLADQLPAGRKFRLPTEAEWEFAARGGNYSSGYQFSGSDNIAEVAWYVDNTFYSPNIVKTMMPNELGIYDMSGNLYEWCSDFHDDKYYASSPLDNPTGPGVSGKRRVIRGGSWDLPWDHCRVSNRNRCPVDARGFSNGMRLALDADPDAKPVQGKTAVAVDVDGEWLQGIWDAGGECEGGEYLLFDNGTYEHRIDYIMMNSELGTYRLAGNSVVLTPVISKGLMRTYDEHTVTYSGMIEVSDYIENPEPQSFVINVNNRTIGDMKRKGFGETITREEFFEAKASVKSALKK